MRLLVVTDAWHPQVNGVVRTLDTVVSHLVRGGDAVEVVGPDRFRTFSLPSSPEIRVVLRQRRRLTRIVEEFPTLSFPAFRRVWAAPKDGAFEDPRWNGLKHRVAAPIGAEGSRQTRHSRRRVSAALDR